MMNKHNGSGPKREVIDINSQTVLVYPNLLVSKRSSIRYCGGKYALVYHVREWPQDNGVQRKSTVSLRGHRKPSNEWCMEVMAGQSIAG